MNFSIATRCPFFQNRLTLVAIAFALIALVMTSTAFAQLEGFTEPFREVELSSDESGAIAEMEVEEGQLVEAKQVVAQLDTRLQTLQVKISKHLASSTSQIVAARKAYEKRMAIHQRVLGLRHSGSTTESEVIRSEMELSIAESKYLAAQEEGTVREIEYERALVQLDRRTIRAPFSGIVSTIHRRQGEFISPVHPEILTLVQTDRIIAKFNVPSSQLRVFPQGKEFNLEMADGSSVVATVHSVNVQTDAQSGTIEVKLVIENSDNTIRAGEICTLNI